MDLLRSPNVAGEVTSDLLLLLLLLSFVGLRLLLSPLASNVVIRTACCSVGIALPVYSTFKAIESKDQNAQRRPPPDKDRISGTVSPMMEQSGTQYG
ncbi:hypothetical protein RIF29_28514 [Crotalaria pallida]|uniref:Uncharacterized protein n=1 Tax=Crotalaria pallida TaxID=3830 RepID=A0AAN9ED41_CROPI